MRIALIFMLFASFAACSPVNPFTERETAIINSGTEGTVMRLFTTEREEDLELLRTVSSPAEARMLSTDEYRRLLTGMLATVTDPENPGVGIAAPQVGIARRIIAVQRFDLEGEPLRFYLNPVITTASGETVESREGCLSVPGEEGTVIRHASIGIEYNDPDDFTLRRETVEGFTAIIFQHETDHLNGVLFTDKTIDENGEN